MKKIQKRRAAVRALGRSGRSSRKEQAAFLATRRAAVAAWKKLPRELDRLRERLVAVFEKSRPRFEALAEAVGELEAVASLEGSASTPLEHFEDIEQELLAAFEAAPVDWASQSDHAKKAKRV